MKPIDRRKFLQLAAGTGLAALAAGSGARALWLPGDAEKEVSDMNDQQRVRAPAIFISHGSPMVGIETDSYTDALARFGAGLSPTAVAVVSAHWEARGPIRVTTSPQPETIHDFRGFPRALYEVRYPAPGHPELGDEIVERLGAAGFAATREQTRGLDHGAWVPLSRMLPGADVPVVQISLTQPRTPEELLLLGEALRPLRERGVAVLGSGGIVHNLRILDWQDKSAAPAAWARAFDEWVAERLAGDRDLRNWREAPNAHAAVPTTEHFDPVFVTLGAAAQDEIHEPIFTGFHHGTLSMRSFALRSA